MSFVAAPAPPESTTLSDPISSGLAESLRELIYTGQASSQRSLQAEVGMSEIGKVCDRELAYKVHGVAPSNFDTDPLASIIGRGTHLELAEILARQNHSGRWLIETSVSYRGIPGTVDAYDRRRRLVLDWKTTSKSKLRTIRADGPAVGHVTQVQGYGAALRQLGEDPQRVALAYLPRDGQLSDLYVWSAVADPSVADQAIDRFERITTTPLAQVAPKPSRLCGWCPFHLPGSTDLARGCPGSSGSNPTLRKA